MNSMSDLLSAISLLLAIITTLYTLFYSSIYEFLNLVPKTHKVDNITNYRKGIEIRNSKIFPILFSSITLSLIFIPETIKILIDSYNIIKTVDKDYIKYDTIKTTYIAVTIFMIALSTSIITLTFKFFKQLSKFKQWCKKSMVTNTDLSSGGYLQTLSFVLLFNFSASWQICAPKPSRMQSPKNVGENYNRPTCLRQQLYKKC